MTDGRKTVRTFALYEEVGERPHGGSKYRVVPVDHEDATPWREGCCTSIEMAMTRGAIKLCMDSDNRDNLGYYIETERDHSGRDETDDERRVPISFCPCCGGALVFKVVRHIRRSYTSRKVTKTVTERAWDHKDEEVPLPAPSGAA